MVLYESFIVQLYLMCKHLIQIFYTEFQMRRHRIRYENNTQACPTATLNYDIYFCHERIYGFWFFNETCA